MPEVTKDALKTMTTPLDDPEKLEETTTVLKKRLDIARGLKAGKSKDVLIKEGFSSDEIDGVLQKMSEFPTGPDKAAKKESLKKLPQRKTEANREAKRKQEGALLAAKQHDLDADYTKQEEAGQADRLDSRMKQIGLSEKDFSSTPEWAALSHGQKMLVLEQAAQETHSNVKETAKERFGAKNKISFKLKDFNLGSFGKKIWKNMGKSYHIHKEEKKAVLDAAQGKLAPEKKILDQLVKRMADMDLPVVEKDGRAHIEFEAIDKNLSPEQKDAVQKYNQIANEYARMPDSWKNERAANDTDTFTKNNYAKYQAVKQKYEQARSALIEVRVKQQQSEGTGLEDATKQTMLGVRDNDLQIALLQFTNTHPDAVGELKKIHDTNSLKKILGDNETVWRGLYMGGGYLARSITASTLGFVAAPLVASIFGGMRARRKAEQKINTAFNEGRTEKSFGEMTSKERLALRGDFLRDKDGAIVKTDLFVEGKDGKLVKTSVPVRSGAGIFKDKNADKKGLMTKIIPGIAEVNAREVAGFVDADSQMQRLTHLLEKIDEAKTPAEKAELMRQLTARISYIEQKKDQGLINFGVNNPIGTNYAFLKLFSDAEVKSQVMNAENPLDLTREQIQTLYEQTNRRQSLTEFVTNYNQNQREFAQRYFKNTETARGALIGAGAAVLGWEIRNLRILRNLFHGSLHGVAGLTPSTSPGLDHTPFVPHTVPDNVDQHFVPKVVHGTVSHPKLHHHIEKIVHHQAPPKIEDHKPDLANEQKPLEEIKDNNVDNTQPITKQVQQNIHPHTGDKGFDKSAGNVRTETDAQLKTNDDNSQFLKDHPQKDLGSNSPTSSIDKPLGDINHQVPLGDGNVEHVNQPIDNIGSRQVPLGSNSHDLNSIQKPLGTGTETNTTTSTDLNSIQKPLSTGQTETLTKPADTETLKSDTYPNRYGSQGGPVKPHTGDFKVDAVDNIHPNQGMENTVDNSLGKPVSLTNQDLLEKQLDAETGYNINADQIDQHLTMENIASDPHHFQTANNLREAIKTDYGGKFYRQDVVITAPPENGLDGLSYQKFNEAYDHMMTNNNIKFASWDDFTYKHHMQEIVGHNEYVNTGSSLEVKVEDYATFDNGEPWKIMEKIAAKYFFRDFNHATFLDGKSLSPNQLNMLIKDGYVNDRLSNPLTGEHTYSFARQGELARIRDTYQKLVPDSYKRLGEPKGNETLDDYIGRMSKRVYQTDDGALYGVKRQVSWNTETARRLNVQNAQQNYNNNLANNNSRNFDQPYYEGGNTPDISTNHGVFEGRSNKNNKILNSFMNLLLRNFNNNSSSWTTPVPLTKHY